MVYQINARSNEVMAKSICIPGFVYHVPEFLDKYGYIHDIGVSQRKNKQQKETFFRGTNWGGGKQRMKICKQVGSKDTM